MYLCGLTPSAESHLGHARSFMFFDVLRRYLVHLGYRVDFVRNVTDIDDRSIQASRQTGVPWNEIIDGYFASFSRSMDRLHVLEPDHEPRVTGYIPEIVTMIEALVAKECAYVVDDGVYFSVASFPRYGALSGRNVDELLIGARIAPGEQKHDPLDFVLWKFAKPGEPSWPSPWGEGRPGWHIECSAMSHALLGEPFDIHGGGYDLIFPHHENEIAQSESLVGPPMANVWMHGGLLQFDGRKMSKSLGNYEPLYALLDRHDPQAVRLLFLQTGYRKPMNFTEGSIEGATAGLRRLQAAYDLLRTAPPVDHDEGTARDRIEPYRSRFFDALDDDMNTSGALSVLFDLAADASDIVPSGAASSAAAFMHEAMALVGMSPSERTHVKAAAANATMTIGDRTFTLTVPGDAETRLPGDTVERLRGSVPGGEPHLNGVTKTEAVNAVIFARIEAKIARDFARADALRAALTAVGVVVNDAKDGATWTVGA
jgi:cysteinyl-tRNA synthetase